MKNALKIFNLSAPVFLYYITNYLIAIYLKSKIGFDEYGHIGIVLSYSVFFQSFIMFGLNNGVDLIVIRKYNWDKYIIHTLLVSIVISFFTIIFLSLFKKYDNLILLGLIHSISFLYVGLYKSRYSSLGDTLAYSKIQYINILISSLLTFFLFQFTKSFYWRIILLIFADIIVVYIFIKSNCKEFFNNIRLKNLFNFYPSFAFYFFSVLQGLFSFFYSNYDRIYLAKYFSFAVSGEYWFYLQLTLPILVFGEALVRYKIRFIFSNDFLFFIKNHINYFFISFIAVIIMYIIITAINFDNLVLNIIMGQFMNALYLPLSALLISREKTKHNLIVTIALAFIQFILFYYFKPDGIIKVSEYFYLLSTIRILIYMILVYKNSMDEKLT